MSDLTLNIGDGLNPLEASPPGILIATPGAIDANSYQSVDELNLYFQFRLDTTAWDDALLTDGMQEAAAIQATNILEQFDYIGVISDSTQALKWPRMADEDGTLIRNYPTSVIPQPIKSAHAEVTLWLLQTGGSGVSTTAAGIKSIQMGKSVKVEYDTGSTTAATPVDTTIDATGIPIQAARFLKGLRLIAVLA